MSKNELSQECLTFLANHAEQYPANEWGSFEQWISHLFINVEDFSAGDMRGSLHDLRNIANPPAEVIHAIEFISYHLNS